MKSSFLKFKNANGYELSARLEKPIDQHPRAYVVFAHCFTCNKNFNAVKNISQSLTSEGFALLRFDFTGLGDSEGAFEDTTFESNLEDLVSAANYLKDNYEAPKLLIGHSLGGTAALLASASMPFVEAVCTIGSPYNPKHVVHLFKESLKEIEEKGAAKVHVGGRPFTIKKAFLDALEKQDMEEAIKQIKKAILILHSPHDTTVGIDNAAKLYAAAMHPKSFVSLNGADHLLTNKADSLYAGDVIASWVKKYLPKQKEEILRTGSEVVVRLEKEDKFTTEILAKPHQLVADEPEEVGGNDFGPSPYELLSASLGACTAMTIRMYADRKNWELDEVLVHLNHGKDYFTDSNDEKSSQKIDVFERIIELKGNLDNGQRNRILEIANRCPVHKTLHAENEIVTKLI